MLKKVLNGIFVGGIAAVLLLGLVRTVFFPKEINEYENRYAEQAAPLTAAGYLDGSFQTQLEAALADQVDPGQTFKDLYNRASSQVLLTAVRYMNSRPQAARPTASPAATSPATPSAPVFAPTAGAAPTPGESAPAPTEGGTPEPVESGAPVASPTPTPEPTPAPEPTPDTSSYRYVNLGTINLFGPDNLVYGTSRPDWVNGSAATRARSYNALIAAHPEVEFYVYYIEKDTDINFETGEKVGVYEAIQSALELPEDHVGRFRVDSFADFAAAFYQTDHHWSLDGSYQGYLDVLKLLGVEDPPLEPLERVDIGTFSGSKGAGRGLTQFTETFSAYRFDFPAMTVRFNGSPAGDYGNQRAYLNGKTDNLSYGSFYGGDGGEIVLSTGRPEREDILMIGESYDNAILKLVASHFNTVYSVDLRYYARDMGEDFHLGAYLADHNISKVLLIGNVDFFLEKTFIVED